jgi:hypothetical protein
MRRLSKTPGFSSLVEVSLLVLVGVLLVAAAALADQTDAPKQSTLEIPAADSATDAILQEPTTDVELKKPAKLPPAEEPSLAEPPVDSKVVEGRRVFSGPREYFRALEIDDSHFEKFFDDSRVGVDELETLLRVLYTLDHFRFRQIEQWTHREPNWQQLQADSRAAQGQFYRYRGRAKRVEVRFPLPEQSRDIDHYFRVELAPESTQPPAVVYTLEIPKAWAQGRDFGKAGKEASWTLDEPVALDGAFLKLGAIDEGHPLVLAARHIAWYPDRLRPEWGVQEGYVLLASLGMDISQLEAVKDRTRLSTDDWEGFYQLLRVVGNTPTADLVRYSKQELERQREALPEMLRETVAQLDDFKGDAQEKKRLLTRRKALEQAVARVQEEGRFSVVPLFILPKEWRGRPMTFEGRVRRIERIRADESVGQQRGLSNIEARFGLDHYYQVFMYPDDAQSNPIAFAVREIPKGLPVGADVNEYLRITGFFFKRWDYKSNDVVKAAAGRKQPAPLLIARTVTWIPRKSKDLSLTGNLYGFIAALLFIAALVGLWISLWLNSRSDKRFEEVALSKNFSVQPGTSLNDLDLQAEDKPDFSGLD